MDIDTSKVTNITPPPPHLDAHHILISIIVPCYNEENTLKLFYTTFIQNITLLNQVAQKHGKSLEYELILVNDGSKDDTKQIATTLKTNDKYIKLFSFSRNFGKESAILCGLDHALGDCVALLDADGQDPIELLPNMLDLWLQGHKIVYTKRVNRQGEGMIRSILSRGFYHISNFMSEVELEPNVRDFRLMDKIVVEKLRNMREYHRFSKAMFEWVGFDKICLEYKNIKRSAGDSSWSFWKLFKYGIDGIVSFSCMPLRVAFVLGLLVSLTSGIYGVYTIFDTLVFGNDVAGYPSLVTIISFLGGLQLLVLGVMGEYIARIYEQGKGRPSYIIDPD